LVEAAGWENQNRIYNLLAICLLQGHQQKRKTSPKVGETADFREDKKRSCRDFHNKSDQGFFFLKDGGNESALRVKKKKKRLNDIGYEHEFE